MVYFVDRAVLDLEDDYFILDIAVGDARPTSELLAVVNNDSNNLAAICL